MKRKIKILGATVLALTAGTLLLSAGTKKASAAEGMELFLPQSYEQYLSLGTPSDVAMNDERIAIADGSKLYLYDRAQESYSVYEHRVNAEARNISKVQFSPDGRLFFSDADTHLFLYDFVAGEAQMQENIPSSTFLIEGGILYSAAVTNSRTTLYAIAHNAPVLNFNSATVIGSYDNGKTPCLFVADGKLCSAVDDNVHVYTPSGEVYIPTVARLAGSTPVHDLSSVAVSDGKIYYTVSGASELSENGLYRTVLDDSSVRVLEGNGFNALSTYGDNLYCIKNSTVRELAVTEEGVRYTGYEIGADSDSVGRLSRAEDIVRARDLVVISDRGNARVSVYDGTADSYSVLQTGEANLVATDGTVIAAAVGNEIKLYRRGETDPYYTHSVTNQVTGIAVIYGKCYYVSEHLYGLAEEGQEGFFRSNSPTSLTSDVFGNLYVADQQMCVRKYTEAEFLDSSFTEGSLATDGWQLPSGYRSLRADFEGNLYYLYENSLYRNSERLRTIDASGLVYRGDAPVPDLVSFALGFEDGGIYLQYGNYVVRMNNVQFPTLSTILSGGAHREIFSPVEKDGLRFADVKAGVTGIGVDVDGISNETPYFPYTDYARTGGGRAVVLYEQGKYLLVALYEDYDYHTALYLSDDCTPSPHVWTDIAPAARYLSSEAALSYFPCLSAPLTEKRLPRATEVSLLATVQNAAGFNFGYVLCGETYGYVPLDYLCSIPPLLTDADEYVLGYLKASEEGVRFRSDDGQTLLVTERTQVRIYGGGDGVYYVRFAKDGVDYTAQVTKKMIQTGNPDSLRISLIIVLSVVAVGIAAAYVLFKPRKRKK